MDTTEFENLLQNTLDVLALGAEVHPEDLPVGIEAVQSFEEAGLLTRDNGVVVTTNDGTGSAQFQITIVRSA